MSINYWILTLDPCDGFELNIVNVLLLFEDNPGPYHKFTKSWWVEVWLSLTSNTCENTTSSTSTTQTAHHLVGCCTGRAHHEISALVAYTIALFCILKMALSSLLSTFLFGENSAPLQYVLENTTKSTYNFALFLKNFSNYFITLIFFYKTVII